MTHSDPFQQFSIFDPTHWGVTGVICVAALTEKWHFWLIDPLGPTCIDVRMHLIDFVHQI